MVCTGHSLGADVAELVSQHVSTVGTRDSGLGAGELGRFVGVDHGPRSAFLGGVLVAVMLNFL